MSSQNRDRVAGTLSIKRIILVVFLAASCNLAWQFYRMQRESIESQRAYEQYGVIVCRFGPSRDEISRLYIEFFLLMAFVGSRLKGLKNTLLSVVGLAGAAIIYILWWQYIFRLAELAEAEVKSMPHVAYLYGGTPLDIGIGASIVLLVVLNVWCATHSLFRPTSGCSGLAGE